MDAPNNDDLRVEDLRQKLVDLALHLKGSDLPVRVVSEPPTPPEPRTVNYEAVLEHVDRLIREWTARVTAGDPHKVAALYSPTATLLSTASGATRHSHEAIVDFFRGFLTGSPKPQFKRYHVHVNKGHTGNIVVLCGEIDFATAAVEPIQARFTMVLSCDPLRGQCAIEHHHTSEVPRNRRRSAN